MFPRLGPDGLAMEGEQTVPVSLPLDLKVVWESKPLDVAFLRAPAVMAAMAEARFFNAAHHAEMATRVRGKWREHHSDTTSLPYFVLGFPNFGHLVEEGPRRIETLSTAALPAYVTQLERDPWDGHGEQAPQLWLEVDATEDRLVIPAVSSSRQSEISRRLFHPRVEDHVGAQRRKRKKPPEPFGGFSGGPVAVVDPDGEYLLGIITQGGALHGSFRVVASCWDDCLSAYVRWQSKQEQKKKAKRKNRSS
jgi:hypothetical protein